MSNLPSNDTDTLKYKLVAPDIDHMIRCFDRHSNPEPPTKSIIPILDELFTLLSPLAPLKQNESTKAIWVIVPRGTIEDFGDYDEMVEYGEVENREEYESLWKSTYPDEVCWYEVVIVEDKDYRGVSIGHNTIISALMDEEPTEQDWRLGDIPDQLITLMMNPIRDSLEKLKNGTYNEWVSSSLPYQFRTGMIKRSVLWQYEPEIRDSDLDGLDEHTIAKFKELLKVPTAGHIKSFTANDFFKACETGYRAIGKETDGYSLSDLYLHYSDGRDEGLTGKGHGLNAGPGIDFEDPKAWDEWYFDSHRGGGHPWEVVSGGNSTHMDLFVCHDRNNLDWRHRVGQISDDDYEKQIERAGYYFSISGKHRPFESVSFFVSLSEAGLPVILNDADEIMARIDGSDFVGIVPHHTIPRYCEGMFPGKVIDFMHVYDEDMVKYGDEIEWLAMENNVPSKPLQ